MYRIQFLDSFVWVTILSFDDEGLIPIQMQQVKDQFPNKRVRCIDSSGRTIDIM